LGVHALATERDGGADSAGDSAAQRSETRRAVRGGAQQAVVLSSMAFSRSDCFI
jgi:hypothetical protein